MDDKKVEEFVEAVRELVAISDFSHQPWVRVVGKVKALLNEFKPTATAGRLVWTGSWRVKVLEAQQKHMGNKGEATVMGLALCSRCASGLDLNKESCSACGARFTGDRMMGEEADKCCAT